jgi:hypothetical protein
VKCGCSIKTQPNPQLETLGDNVASNPSPNPTVPTGHLATNGLVRPSQTLFFGQARSPEPGRGEPRTLRCARVGCAASGASPPGDGAVSVGNGLWWARFGCGVAAARPVALVRYCPGMVGETERAVHVVLSRFTERGTLR